ncbi:MAG: alpha/beta hydrolase-fold protein [Actinocatenispora sp.]
MTTQLALRGVSKSYGQLPVLDRIDLTVRPGERLGVVGDNGSGKSTLLRIAAGAEPADDGQVTSAVDRGVGHPGQTFDPADARTVGETARLALACPLAASPEMLLLDEATDHLSPILVGELEHALAGFPGGLVVVSHDHSLRGRFTGSDASCAPDACAGDPAAHTPVPRTRNGEPMQSVRIEQFVRAAAEDPVRATAELVADLRAAAGPLIERVGDGYLVSFVWVGPQRQVSLRGAQLFEDRNALSHPMTRIDGTEVWYRSVLADPGVTTVYQYLVDDPFLDVDHDDMALLVRLMAEARDRSFADPVNPRRMFPQAAMIAGADQAPQEQWDSVLELPGATTAPWFDGPDTTTCRTRRLTSTALGNERDVTVYLPPGYGAGPYPLVVLLDGEAWLRVGRLHVALDRLIDAGEMAPAVVAFVHNPADAMAARMREMSANPALATMLADELLPMLRDGYAVADGPVVLGGNSLTGLGAAHAAFLRPDAFGAVLACSGSFWWGYRPTADGWGMDDEPEWMTRQFAAGDRRPVRFALDVGSLETGASPLSPGVDQRAANRHLRTVLTAKGYQVSYHESAGGHDFATFRRAAVRGLSTLLPGVARTVRGDGDAEHG